METEVIGYNVAKDGTIELSELNVAVIPSGLDRCIVHKCNFTIVNIRMDNRRVCITAKYCKECERFYYDRNKLERLENLLNEKGLRYNITPFEATLRIWNEQVLFEPFTQNNQIHVLDFWPDINEVVCPEHNKALEYGKYFKEYHGRKVSFEAFTCPVCNKIFMRSAFAADLEFSCSKNGIPPITFIPQNARDKVESKKHETKKPANKFSKPDYLIHNGVLNKYNYDVNVSFDLLAQDDIVVVTDSNVCTFDEHKSDESRTAVFEVIRKDGNNCRYAAILSWCDECSKYYMSKKDYAVLYSAGRPVCQIVDDTNTFDLVVSGKIFDDESMYLSILGRRLDLLIESIKPEVTRYDVSNDYDEIARLQYSKKMNKEIYDRIKSYGEIKSRPYFARFDIMKDEKNCTYYIGKDDVEIDGEMQVVSRWSDIGKLFGASRDIEFNENGKIGKVLLRRQFEIHNTQLFGYQNTYSNDEAIFRDGITDPFLVRVLRTRKRQHQLTDIISTIQERQNEIIDVPYDSNIIVQGCAGSGKTMVLLHRLSYLKYNNPNMDLSKIRILTPSENFNMHISALAKDLHLEEIERCSIEQYYQEYLMKCDSSFALEYLLASEDSINQNIVDFIYSDEYIADLEQVYPKWIKQVLSGMNIEKVQHILEKNNFLTVSMASSTDYEKIRSMKLAISSFLSSNKERHGRVDRAQKHLLDLENEKRILEDKIQRNEPQLFELITTMKSEIVRQLNDFLANFESSEALLQEEIKKLLEVRKYAENSIVFIGKRGRLKKIDQDIQNVDDQLQKNRSQRQWVQEKLATNIEEDFDSMLSSLGTTGILNTELMNLLQQGSRIQKNNGRDKDQLVANRLEAEKAKAEIEQLKAEVYSEEDVLKIRDIASFFNELTPESCSNTIFDICTERIREKYSLKPIRGIRRCNLYARILFAIKFFGLKQDNIQYFCIDEGQDMSFNEYRLLKRINVSNMVFNIYGDKNQLLKDRRGIADWTSLQSIFNARQFVLNENYRNTNQITRFCNNHFGYDTLLTGVDGKKVREIPRDRIEQDINKLAINTERIAILIPKTIPKNKAINMELIVPARRELIGSKINNGCITLANVDEIKGLEFDMVYVFSDDMSKNEKYIAFTRALSELVVVIDTNK